MVRFHAPRHLKMTVCGRDVIPMWQVNIGLRVLTRPNPDRLPQIYRSLGTDYAERVLPSIIQVHERPLSMACSTEYEHSHSGRSYILSPDACRAFFLQETLKSVVAQYNASQLLTMREVVSKDILRILTERARFFDIILDDVSITQLTFSKVYEAAVEAKQVAQQEAERAKFVVSSTYLLVVYLYMLKESGWFLTLSHERGMAGLSRSCVHLSVNWGHVPLFLSHALCLMPPPGRQGVAREAELHRQGPGRGCIS